MCRRVGMADEADSKSVVGNHVRVQVPLPAFYLVSQIKNLTKLFSNIYFIFVSNYFRYFMGFSEKVQLKNSKNQL